MGEQKKKRGGKRTNKRQIGTEVRRGRTPVSGTRPRLLFVVVCMGEEEKKREEEKEKTADVLSFEEANPGGRRLKKHATFFAKRLVLMRSEDVRRSDGEKK